MINLPLHNFHRTLHYIATVIVLVLLVNHGFSKHVWFQEKGGIVHYHPK